MAINRGMSRKAGRDEAGASLLECLVYCGLMLIIVWLALEGFYRGFPKEVLEALSGCRLDQAQVFGGKLFKPATDGIDIQSIRNIFGRPRRT